MSLRETLHPFATPALVAANRQETKTSFIYRCITVRELANSKFGDTSLQFL